jgi:hypothetical protein
MDFITPKNSLNKEKIVQSIIERIIVKVKDDLNINNAEHKNNIELLLMICTIIENFISNKGKKDKKRFNKLAILHEIYKRLFVGITQPELDAIGANVEMLIDRDMIKTYSFAKRIWKNLKVWIQKKVL